MSNEDIAKATEGLLSTQENEALFVEGASRQNTELLRQQEELTDKLIGFSQAISDSREEFVSLMDSVSNDISKYLTIVATRNNSDVPTWLAPFCSVQYGYEPVSEGASLVEDLKDSGPFSGATVVAGTEWVDENFNQGGQFPSLVTLPNVGPDSDLSLNLMSWKGAIPPDTSSYDDVHKTTFSSSMGVWAVHYPWNGIVTEFVGSGGNITKVKSETTYTNDPGLRYGRINEDNSSRHDEYIGNGWGTALGDGWGKNLLGLTSLGTEVIKKHYEDYVLANSNIVIVDRKTGLTHSTSVTAVTLEGASEGQTIAFDVSFDSNAIFGKDLSTEDLGNFAYMCIDASGGKHDQTYGFTAFMAWNCFQKDIDGEWRTFDGSTAFNGIPTLRQTGYDGSGLFINSTTLHGDVLTGIPYESRDLFYHLNVDEVTLKEKGLYEANQLQGVYAGMIRDLASPKGGWGNQWLSTVAALDVAKQTDSIYNNEETFDLIGAPIKPTERYLSLLRSTYSGVSLSVPVDVLHEGEITGGIRLTLLTGAMYKAND